MAGVASGLALATTLMAMQVADTMSSRRTSCPGQAIAAASEQGFLGIRYVYSDGAAHVHSVIPGTPAAKIGIQRGDRVLAINGDPIDSAGELQATISAASPGAQPTILIDRAGERRELRPRLTSWPDLRY
jgi:S1-C subfamily serine protease